MIGLINDGKINNEQKVKKITEIYDKLELNKITEKKIEEYFKAGLKNFSGINAPLYKKRMLCDFIKELTKREN